MPYLSFSLVDESYGKPDVMYRNGVYKLKYPCKDSWDCTPYKTRLTKGAYLIELYGASGGSHRQTSSFRFGNNTYLSDEIVRRYHGNVKANRYLGIGGSGGYTSGLLVVPEDADFFIRIGGEGELRESPGNTSNCKETENENYRPRGGYNGGGKGTVLYNDLLSGGGGATDIRAKRDSVFNRIMVAGAGGGTDNINGGFGGTDDGTGGAGGGLVAQGYFINGVLDSSHVANQTAGFSFGQGESALWEGSKHPNGVKKGTGSSDRAGAGGGWFGGFASHHGNGGAGGGSSFALTNKAVYPKDLIHVYDDLYNEVDSGYYAFQNHEYTVIKEVFVAGIWYGNGFATIKPISLYCRLTSSCRTGRHPMSILFIIALIS